MIREIHVLAISFGMMHIPVAGSINTNIETNRLNRGYISWNDYSSGIALHHTCEQVDEQST